MTTDSWPPPEGAEPGNPGLEYEDACRLGTGAPMEEFAGPRGGRRPREARTADRPGPTTERRHTKSVCTL
jgi:hypothetical protein